MVEMKRREFVAGVGAALVAGPALAIPRQVTHYDRVMWLEANKTSPHTQLFIDPSNGVAGYCYTKLRFQDSDSPPTHIPFTKWSFWELSWDEVKNWKGVQWDGTNWSEIKWTNNTGAEKARIYVPEIEAWA